MSHLYHPWYTINHCSIVLQIHLRPPVGSSDTTHRRRWDDIIREAEKNLLNLQSEWVSSQRQQYDLLAKETLAALKERMGDSEEFKDAESAVNTVACRVRTDTLTTEQKKWSLAVEKYESESLGIDKRRQTKKVRGNREPQPGTSHQSGPSKPTRRPQGKGNKGKGSNGQNNKAISDLVKLLLKK